MLWSRFLALRLLKINLSRLSALLYTAYRTFNWHRSEFIYLFSFLYSYYKPFFFEILLSSSCFGIMLWYCAYDTSVN